MYAIFKYEVAKRAAGATEPPNVLSTGDLLAEHVCERKVNLKYFVVNIEKFDQCINKYYVSLLMKMLFHLLPELSLDRNHLQLFTSPIRHFVKNNSKPKHIFFKTASSWQKYILFKGMRQTQVEYESCFCIRGWYK